MYDRYMHSGNVFNNVFGDYGTVWVKGKIWGNAWFDFLM